MKLGQPSYFDTENAAQQKKIWEQLKEPQQQYQAQGTFQKKSRKSSSLKQVDLFISSEFLYYAKKGKQPKSQLYLVLVKLDILDNNGFRLTRNRQTFEFYIEDEIEFLNWKSLLIYKCFQSTFHEEFQVTKMIGKGSFAKVYYAIKKSNGQEYAVKAFNKEFMSQQYRGKESLENEIKVMRKLSHENLVKLYEVYETMNSIYFILDMLKGGELLYRVRQKGSLSSSDLQKLIFNLLKALAHLHTKKCVHRDLKPENLLLKSKDNDYDIIIADFGLAAFLDDNIIFKRCGTPGFVAPEILLYKDGEPFYKENCDVFSAGVIFYLLLTGKQPFQAADFKQILRANKICEINFGLKQIVNSSNSLQQLLKGMLSPDPKIRLTSEDCLKHPFFNQLLENELQQQEENFKYYEKDFLYGLKKNIQESQEYVGSMELQNRSPAMNGNVNTIGSLTQDSNASFSKIEVTNKQVGASKFSQFSQKAIQNQQIVEGAGLSSPSNRQLKSNDLHKKALKNSMYSTMQKQEFDDQNMEIDEEEPQLQKNLSQLSQGQTKFLIKGSNSPKSSQKKND